MLKEKILCSACLLWKNCKFNWWNNLNKKLIQIYSKTHILIPVCPEQLGWLDTPRIPAELVWNDVFTKNWKDVTSQFTKWAQKTLGIARKEWIKKAILKQKSPSCWSWKIYDGTFSWKITNWDWITTKLLKQDWITVITEEDIW